MNISESITSLALTLSNKKISFTFFSICEWDATKCWVFRQHRYFSHRWREVTLSNGARCEGGGGQWNMTDSSNERFDILWLFSMENSFRINLRFSLFGSFFPFFPFLVSAESRNRGRWEVNKIKLRWIWRQKRFLPALERSMKEEWRSFRCSGKTARDLYVVNGDAARSGEKCLVNTVLCIRGRSTIYL